MNVSPFLLGAVVLCSLAPDSSAQQVVPEAPSLWREVTGVWDQGTGTTSADRDPRFTRPHLSAMRTTADGRLGVIVEGGWGEFVQSADAELELDEQIFTEISPIVATDDGVKLPPDQDEQDD